MQKVVTENRTDLTVFALDVHAGSRSMRVADWSVQNAGHGTMTKTDTLEYTQEFEENHQLWRRPLRAYAELAR